AVEVFDGDGGQPLDAAAVGHRDDRQARIDPDGVGNPIAVVIDVPGQPEIGEGRVRRVEQWIRRIDQIVKEVLELDVPGSRWGSWGSWGRAECQERIAAGEIRVVPRHRPEDAAAHDVVDAGQLKGRERIAARARDERVVAGSKDSVESKGKG